MSQKRTAGLTNSNMLLASSSDGHVPVSLSDAATAADQKQWCAASALFIHIRNEDITALVVLDLISGTLSTVVADISG